LGKSGRTPGLLQAPRWRGAEAEWAPGLPKTARASIRISPFFLKFPRPDSRITMRAAIRVTVKAIRGGVKISLTGQVIKRSSPRLRAKLLEVAAGTPALLLVDLSRVKRMDSSGVATLVECAQRLKGRATRLVLVGAGPDLRSVFTVLRIDPLFAFCGTEEEALKA